MKKAQSGFTLVEIAIVLVIIGLLLGGVLKGQELINNARVKNVIDQGNGVKAAYFAFMDRYHAVPGDYSAATVNLPNGAVGIVNGGGNGQINTNGERGQAWLQMGRAGFLNGTFNGAAVADNLTCPIATCPTNAYGSPLMITFASHATGTTAVGQELRTGSNIPVGIIAEVDRKIDDGIPGQGSFQNDDGGTGACVAAGIWDVANANPITNCTGTHRF